MNVTQFSCKLNRTVGVLSNFFQSLPVLGRVQAFVWDWCSLWWNVAHFCFPYRMPFITRIHFDFCISPSIWCIEKDNRCLTTHVFGEGPNALIFFLLLLLLSDLFECSMKLSIFWRCLVHANERQNDIIIYKMYVDVWHVRKMFPLNDLP